MEQTVEVLVVLSWPWITVLSGVLLSYETFNGSPFSMNQDIPNPFPLLSAWFYCLLSRSPTYLIPSTHTGHVLGCFVIHSSWAVLGGWYFLRYYSWCSIAWLALATSTKLWGSQNASHSNTYKHILLPLIQKYFFFFYLWADKVIGVLQRAGKACGFVGSFCHYLWPCMTNFVLHLFKKRVILPSFWAILETPWDFTCKCFKWRNLKVMSRGKFCAVPREAYFTLPLAFLKVEGDGYVWMCTRAESRNQSYFCITW